MEELGNQVQIVIGALDTGVPHVPAEVWEHRVDIDTIGDPPVEIANSEVMPEVVRPRLVASRSGGHWATTPAHRGHLQTARWTAQVCQSLLEGTQHRAGG